MMPDSAMSAHVAAGLERSGYAIVDAFLDDSTVAALAAECLDLHARAQLRPAAIGHGEGRHVDVALRGDRTHWFDPAALSAAQTRYWSRMDRLRHELNRALLLGLDELEAHFALFPAGSRYARHRDRFRDDDTRVLSTVLYLNAGWKRSEGGALRLYVGSDATVTHHDVLPVAGTLAVFLSADFEHEVMPAGRDRMSIAGWLRRASIPVR